MSDLRNHDAAVVWIEDGDLHGTFHHTHVAGCRSLALWRFLSCQHESHLEHECSSCMVWLNHCFHDDDAWKCQWCHKDQHICLCEVDASGLVWTEHGVGIPKEDFDLPF